MSRLCSSCQSGNRRSYMAEINIHFPGLKGIDIPTVWVFPEILVCMDCGEAQFQIPETEVKELVERDYRYQAAKKRASSKECSATDDGGALAMSHSSLYSR